MRGKGKMRKLISIKIDHEVWRTAREMGFNISKLCENALKQATQRLQTFNYETGFRNDPVNTQNNNYWCSGRDLNPGLRLERPEYLAGLYSAERFSSTGAFRSAII